MIYWIVRKKNGTECIFLEDATSDDVPESSASSNTTNTANLILIEE